MNFSNFYALTQAVLPNGRHIKVSKFLIREWLKFVIIFVITSMKGDAL
jgi:hypothetical protein